MTLNRHGNRCLKGFHSVTTSGVLEKFLVTGNTNFRLFTAVKVLLLGPPGSIWCFSFAPELVGYSAPRDLHRRAAYSICESWFLIHQDVYHDLFVCS